MWIIDHLSHILFTVIISAYAISLLVVIGVMILENRSPLKSLSWILVLLLIPGIGVILYIFFGQNLRKQKIIARKGLKNNKIIISVANAQSKNLLKSKFLSQTTIKDKERILKLQLRNSNSVITDGNKVTHLKNGGPTFDSIIEELEKARKFIHIQYYIFANDNIGTQIKNILIKKALAGVEVRLIVDDVGSWELKSDFFKELRSVGIEAYSFLQVRFPKFTSKVNYRNHRKIIIIDGYIGFMGGINVADRYIHGNKDYGIWRDTHIKIEGDAVNSLQSIFLIDWFFVSQKELIDAKYFPIKKPVDNKVVQISASGPDSDWPGIMMGIFQMIAGAKDYIYITTPYFMPNESVLMALKTAAMGGIDVRIIIPERSDAYVTKYSSMSYIKEMLLSGIKIYFYQKGFIHSKVVVSDDIIASVGSANMDFRSFEQNFEVTAFIYDEDFAIDIKTTFLEDLADSTRVHLKSWRKRPLKQKIIESSARLLSPLL